MHLRDHERARFYKTNVQLRDSAPAGVHALAYDSTAALMVALTMPETQLSSLDLDVTDRIPSAYELIQRALALNTPYTDTSSTRSSTAAPIRQPCSPSTPVANTSRVVRPQSPEEESDEDEDAEDDDAVATASPTSATPSGHHGAKSNEDATDDNTAISHSGRCSVGRSIRASKRESSSEESGSGGEDDKSSGDAEDEDEDEDEDSANDSSDVHMSSPSASQG